MSERNESGLTTIQEGRLIARAIKKGWNGPQRFATRRTKSELQKKIEDRDGDATLIERCELSAHELMEGEDKEKAQGAKIVLQMERQNLVAERMELEIDGMVGGDLDPLTEPPVDAAPASVTNTQINIYLPDNGRGPMLPSKHEHNGHAG